MSRKIILLNFALLALAGTMIWQARKHYLEMKAHEREVLQRSVRPTPVLPPPSIPAPAPVAAIQYTEVAQKTLFAKDRNPTVIIETPPPKPEPPMPALPTYYGQMNFGDPVVLLSIRNGEQKRFHVGDKVGDFKLVRFDRDRIVFGWNDKEVEKKLDELKVKSDQSSQLQGQAPANQASPGSVPFNPLSLSGPSPRNPAPTQDPVSKGPSVRSVSGSSSSDDTVKPDSPVGNTISGTEFRVCSLSEPTPAGTVVDGYRKVVSNTMMGKTCYWEKVK
jgi:hypothetical protein